MKTKINQGSHKKTDIDIQKEEAVKSFVYPVKLSDQERKQSNSALSQLRSEWKSKASQEDFLLAKVLQLKFQLEDYLESNEYDEKKGFSYFLKMYLEILDKKYIDFANDIHTHKTLISQLINNTRVPNDTFFIRLEIHSNNIIPAEHWLQLIQKDKVHDLKTNSNLRRMEKKYVAGKIPVRLSTGRKKNNTINTHEVQNT